MARPTTAKEVRRRASAMVDVIELLAAGRLHEAMVRLAVLARRRAEQDLALNAWERARGPVSEAEANEARWRALLEAGDGADDRRLLEADPLSLLRALDELLGADSPDRWPFYEPYHVDGEAYWLVPVRLGRSSAAASAHQSGNLQAWMRHHRVVPVEPSADLRIEVRPSRDVTDGALRELRERGRLRAYVAHFVDDAALEPPPPPQGKFFVRGLSNDEARRAGALRALEHAIAERADVLVFPELSLTPTHRDAHVRKGIRLARSRGAAPVLTVPGSFHEELDPDDATSVSRRRVNRALLVGPDGRVVSSHSKLRIYGKVDGASEDIDSASVLEVLVTPIGIVAVVICKDFCDQFSPVVRDCHRMAFVDWWLVPSMGDATTTVAHERQAESAWKVANRCTTVVANQEPSQAAGQSSASFDPGFVFDGSRRDAVAGGSVIAMDLEDFKRLAGPADIGRLRMVRGGRGPGENPE